MRDEEADRLFQTAATIGERYNIALLGDDSIVPMRNFKLSDTEHVIHELAHAILWGLDTNDPGVIELIGGLDTSEQENQVNEIEAFSVTMETLRRLGAGDEIDLQAFIDALEIQLHGFEYPKEWSWPEKRQKHWVRAQLAEFHATDRGKAAVAALVHMFEKEGYTCPT